MPANGFWNSPAAKARAASSCPGWAAGMTGWISPPSAVEKATAACAAFPNARIRCLDMVKENAGDGYDAALDCMGLHMLVTDRDRQAYLGNAFRALKPGAPMLFFRQSYRKSAYDGTVETYKQWQDITGEDYVIPGVRTVKNGDRDIDVRIPLVPARARTKAGYERELQAAGFQILDFIEMDWNTENPYSASLFVRKP